MSSSFISHAFTHTLLAAQPESTRSRLLILAGHDHKQHVEEKGATLLVDGGTVGASGPLAIGEQSVGLIELRLDAGHAVRLSI
jgi:predicted phosphodiesterase